MKRIEAEEIIGELDEIIFLIGNRDICYVFHVDKKIKVVKLSINAMDIILKEFSFIRINLYNIINTKFYLKNNPGRKKEIILKNGIILSVSRKVWKVFENIT